MHFKHYLLVVICALLCYLSGAEGQYWQQTIAETNDMANDLSNATIYFGYGSNLWLDQMKQRCPTSKYLGVARLNNYRWIINQRGYANVVEIKKKTDKPEPYANEVWGLVYSLQELDEHRLDGNEGVPIAYTKEVLNVDFWRTNGSQAANITEQPKQVDMLVYISRDKVKPSKPKEEYIYRMNMGIKDALKEGVPEKYVEKVMREFIPEKGDEKVVEFAKKQALMFEDER